jgi:phosphoglycolate phosphatase
MKAVLFDLDGTVIDSSEGVTNCVRYALKHYGIEETDFKKLCRFIGPPLKDSFKREYGFSPEQAQEALTTYRERYNRIGIFECKLYPGMAECLRTLRRMGYRVGLASSKPEPSCRRILEHFGILELFDEVVGATFDDTRKKKVDILKEVFCRWDDIAPEEMCLVGDTIYDVAGANAVGIPCIAVSFGFGNMQEMVEAGIAGSCDSMEELPDVVRRL